MFGYITGKILNLKPTKVILMVGGLGFNVNSTLSYIERLKTGQEASFWTHTAVRETSIDLYGFETEEELQVFELLLTVSGVGPKSALAILGVAGVRSIEEAVATRDISSLTKISGVGKKTAEKIVIELNGKLVSSNKGMVSQNENIEIYEVLQSLGFRDRDIQETIKMLPKELSNTNEKIKYALKNLGK